MDFKTKDLSSGQSEKLICVKDCGSVGSAGSVASVGSVDSVSSVGSVNSAGRWVLDC